MILGMKRNTIFIFSTRLILFYYKLNSNIILYKRIVKMSSKWVPTKPNFGPPPPGYVAGIGRGAHGFTTRGDLGPAQTSVQAKQADNNQASYADSKYDSWQGYKGALFVRQGMDEEDRQAQQAYDFCQKRVSQRRLAKKQERMKQQIKKQEKNPLNVPISQLFTDLKRDLAKVTEQQWSTIPDAVDLSIKKQKKQKYVPVPDSMLVNYITSNVTNKTVTQQESNRQYREAKSMLLKTNLEKAENQTSNQGRKFDRIGYLTSLDTSKKDQQFLGDIKRARLLHKSALEHNPKNPDIWLSAARIQELDGKIVEARKILRKSLQFCGGRQDIWIQLSRIQKAEDSKTVLIEALRNLPKSQKIWLTMAKKQSSNKQTMSKVLRKGLQNIPQSAKLWKELIELQDLQQAKKLLYKAVQCLPKQIDLWIGLAKLQTYQNAKSILNKARRANPLSLAIWINAAKLQETQSNDHKKTVDKIQMLIRKARSTLQKNGKTISRQQWLQQALVCERSNNLFTCESIVKATIMLGLTEDELNQSLFKDVNLFEKQEQSIYTTRFLYREGISLTKNPRLLEKLLQFEERLSLAKKKSEIIEGMNFGLKIFPDHPLLWLGLIDRFIDNKQFQNARALIDKASQSMKQTQAESIYLKKVKILKLQGKYQQARQLLGSLSQKYSNSESTEQLILFEFQIGNYIQAWKICSQIFKQKKNQNIWDLAIKIKKQIGSYQQCKSLVQKATAQNPNSIYLWKKYIQLEIQNNFLNKARAVIDKALLKNPKNQQLYLTLIDMELKTGNKKLASTTIAKAIKQCPKSGQIWARSILLEPHNIQKKKASVAIQNCGNCSEISLTVGKIFWKDNKIDKARNWLEQAIKLDRSNGDLWGYYIKLMNQNFPNQRNLVIHEFHQIKKMTHGRKWLQITNRKNNWKLNSQQILQCFIKEVSEQMDS